ncbi:hypothetical protein AOLI_G00244160 [Acnodon oligacanthus]
MLLLTEIWKNGDGDADTSGSSRGFLSPREVWSVEFGDAKRSPGTSSSEKSKLQTRRPAIRDTPLPAGSAVSHCTCLTAGLTLPPRWSCDGG